MLTWQQAFSLHSFIIPISLIRRLRLGETEQSCQALPVTLEPGFEPRRPGSGVCPVTASPHCPWKQLWTEELSFSSFWIPHRMGHAIERLRTHFKDWLGGQMEFCATGHRLLPSHQWAFEEGHSGKGPQGHGQPLHRRRLEENRLGGWSLPPDWFSGTPPFGLNGTVTTAPESSKGEPVTCRLQITSENPGVEPSEAAANTAMSLIKAHANHSTVPQCFANITSRLYSRHPGSSSPAPSPRLPAPVIQEAQQCVQAASVRTKAQRKRSPLFLSHDSSWGCNSRLPH